MVEGGLLMTGRQIPTTAAAGMVDFDAQAIYIQERSLAYGEQSTASLLIGLAAALRAEGRGSRQLDEDRVLTIWRELEARSVPVERVVRGAILPQMAVQIAAHAALSHVARSGELPATASVALRRELADIPAGSWSALLDALVDSFGSGPDGALHAFINSSTPYRGLAPGLPRRPLSERDEADAIDVPLDAHVVLALSPGFLGRVEEWLARLLEEDLLAALAATPPPPSVFFALQHDRVVRDETGLWIWERLAVTDFAEWSDSSLLLEWRYLRGEYAGSCPDRVFAERVTAREVIAERALERMSRSRGQHIEPQDLHPMHFVRQAVEHLKGGRCEDAASIFRGLVEIRPADGDAWNNLGFCELYSRPASGFAALEQASLYELEQPLINVANRCLALHLLGRDEEAVALAEASAYLRSGSPASAYLWRHRSRSEPLVLEEDAHPVEYLDGLVAHLTAGDCE
ncbi:hypothetical protein CBP52_16770 [Cellulomonas sp. PSBB021]|nr:hypothetical protein CBP52_16770 [Cellulomonas sp. PSBB021]